MGSVESQGKRNPLHVWAARARTARSRRRGGSWPAGDGGDEVGAAAGAGVASGRSRRRGRAARQQRGSDAAGAGR